MGKKPSSNKALKKQRRNDAAAGTAQSTAESSGGSSKLVVLKYLSIVSVGIAIAFVSSKYQLVSHTHTAEPAAVSAMKKEAHVITMDAKSDRYQTFLYRNDHLIPHLHRWDAVDGRRIDFSLAVSENIISPEFVGAKGPPTPGAMGVALSHTRIWRHLAASDSKEAVLVLEDDAYTHPQILEYGRKHASQLSKADITLCGWNTDSILLSTDKRNFSSTTVGTPAHPSAKWMTNALHVTDIDEVRQHKLLNAFGLLCYWISPSGARKLLDAPILPLNPKHVFIEPDDQGKAQWPPKGKGSLVSFGKQMTTVRESAIDMRLNSLYDKYDSRVLQPPLAYSANDQKTSTTIRKKNTTSSTAGAANADGAVTATVENDSSNEEEAQKKKLYSREELRAFLSPVRGAGTQQTTTTTLEEM